ncbi:histidine kinase [Streptomyces sp. NPDC005485]|uniref:sensor histidine kinase n=1 Tax=Streptomyces sp. NPDC005485 TaxID=3155591 RepID=UPI0033A958F0
MSRCRSGGENGPVTNALARDRIRGWARPLLRTTGPLPRPTRGELVFDAALALVIAVGSAQYALDDASVKVPLGVPMPPEPPGVADPTHVQTGGGGWTFLVLALVIVTTGSLMVRRRYPLTVLWIVTAAILLTPNDVPRLTFYASMVAGYSAAAYGPYRVPTLVSLPVAVLLITGARDSSLPTVPTQYTPLLILVPLVFAASGLRTWKLRTAEGRARLAALEHGRADELRRAVEYERARIARELHDVVTHNVSVMVIQAGAARKVMTVDQEQAREALLAVESGGRAALAELRHVMGLLTMDAEGDGGTQDAESAAADLTPQPGLDRLAALVARIGETGMPIEFTVTGQPRPLPAGIELAAYRVVQEALTNAVKHAGGASTAVTVAYAADLLDVEVADTGGSPDPAAVPGSGRGLIGLRERLAVYDGTLHTGHRPTGGWRVRALIPLETTP